MRKHITEERRVEKVILERPDTGLNLAYFPVLAMVTPGYILVIN